MLILKLEYLLIPLKLCVFRPGLLEFILYHIVEFLILLDVFLSSLPDFLEIRVASENFSQHFSLIFFSSFDLTGLVDFVGFIMTQI